MAAVAELARERVQSAPLNRQGVQVQWSRRLSQRRLCAMGLEVHLIAKRVPRRLEQTLLRRCSKRGHALNTYNGGGSTADAHKR